MAKLSEEDIGRLANAEVSAAVTYDGTDFQKNRVRAMEYYRGEMKDLENEDGLSKVSTHDVQDVIGWILPGLMRVFFSSDELGQYNPEDEDDEDGAKQATDYANYVILKECDGYQTFWDVFHDALLFANGIVKHWWDESEKTTVHVATGLTDDQFAQLVNSDEIEILAHREDQIALPPPEPDDDDAPIMLPPPQGGPPAPQPGGPPGGPPALSGGPPTGAPPPPNGGGGPPMNGGPPPPNGGGPQPPMNPMAMLAQMLPQGGPPMPPEPLVQTFHSVKVKRTQKVGKLKIAAVPPEEFLINIQARDVKSARMVGHRMTKTRGDLVQEGYDKKKVYDLPAASFPNYANLPQTRIDNAMAYQTPSGLDKSMEEVEIVEVYMKMDVDGDGIAEMQKIVLGGPNTNVVLDNELWEDDSPFSDFVAERVPHRWQGRSVFDDTEDIQQIKSTLLRQFLDNLYHSNIPDRAVDIGRIATPDALLDRKIGNIIHTEGPPGEAIADLQVPFVAKEALTGLEYMDQIIERRTGVSRSTMALDLEALQNQSATAVNAAQSASYSKIELIARNFAEVGFKNFFEAVLKLIVAHQDGPRKIKIKKNWVTMDPSSWNANMKFDVNVGLGSGSRDRDAQILLQIAMKQETINMQLGPDNPLCGLDKYSNTLRSLVQMALPGGDPDKYFNELDEKKLAAWAQKQQAQQAQQPNPEMMKAQAAAQKAQAEIQMKQQKGAADLQLQQQKTQADMAAAGQKNAMDMAAQREKNAMTLQLDREKAAADIEQQKEAAMLDAQLKQQELLLEAHLAAQQNEMQAGVTRENNRWNADNVAAKNQSAAEVQREHNRNMAKNAATKVKADTNIRQQMIKTKGK